MATQINKVDVSIIIVNYKSWKHLRNCLGSLSFQKDQFTFEIIVVDNCSNDDQFDRFKEEFLHVNFILNSGNNGFANGCNVGASEAKGKYLLFLNPDTIANSKAILQMWRFAKGNPVIGIVSCEQKKKNGGYEKSIRVFPSLPTLFGLTRAIYKVFNKNQFDIEEKILYPDWVSGSVVMISDEWLNQINGWNEDYWMYFEDVDLCKRVNIANGKIALLKNEEIIHNHGGASRINMKTSSLTKTEVQISKHVYINTHFKGIEKFISLILLVIINLIVRLILGVFGIVFFFIPKMRLNVYLLAKTVRYYFGSLSRRSWLSINSTNLKIK